MINKVINEMSTFGAKQTLFHEEFLNRFSVYRLKG